MWVGVSSDPLGPFTFANSDGVHMNEPLQLNWGEQKRDSGNGEVPPATVPPTATLEIASELRLSPQLEEIFQSKESALKTLNEALPPLEQEKD